MKVENYANISTELITLLNNEMARCENLLQVMTWNSAVVDVIVQDEFTRDVVLRWRDDLFLVFDAT